MIAFFLALTDDIAFFLAQIAYVTSIKEMIETLVLHN